MSQTNESVVRDLLERWATAVRAKNMPEVLANHAPDFVMFDVPPPFESRGLAAYEDAWKLFYSSQPNPISFRYQVAGGCCGRSCRVCFCAHAVRRANSEGATDASGFPIDRRAAEN
jgi:hypothetical protein